MIQDFIKVVALVNGCLVTSFGIFYEGVKLCNELGLTPWLAGAASMVAYMAFSFRALRRAS